MTIRTAYGDAIDFGGNTHAFAYACFACRKSFRRPLVSLKAPLRHGSQAEQEAFRRRDRFFTRNFTHKCPQCAGPSHFMGRDFKAPKMSDLKGWARVERFITTGRTYHSGTPVDDHLIRRR